MPFQLSMRSNESPENNAFSGAAEKRWRRSHIFLVILYVILMLACVVLLVQWLRAKIKRHRKRNKWGYRSINDCDSYGIKMTQRHLPSAPSVTKSNWLRIYHVFTIIGCIIRIASLLMCFWDDPSSEDNDFNESSFKEPKEQKDKNEVSWDLAFSFAGSYCFVLSFLIVLCCLAEVYHSSGESEMQQRVRFIQNLQSNSGMSSGNWEVPVIGAIARVRRVTTAIIVFTIMLIAGTFLLGAFCHKDPNSKTDNILCSLPQIIAIIFYIVFFIGFIVYGVLIFRQTRSLLKSFRLKSNDTLKNSIHAANIALIRIIFMVFVSAACFIIRAIVISIQTSSIFTGNEKLADISFVGWYIDLIYYTLLEFLPLVSTLIIFIIIPSREKRSDEISIAPIASY